MTYIGSIRMDDVWQYAKTPEQDGRRSLTISEIESIIRQHGYHDPFDADCTNQEHGVNTHYGNHTYALYY